MRFKLPLEKHHLFALPAEALAERWPQISLWMCRLFSFITGFNISSWEMSWHSVLSVLSVYVCVSSSQLLLIHSVSLYRGARSSSPLTPLLLSFNLLMACRGITVCLSRFLSVRWALALWPSALRSRCSDPLSSSVKTQLTKLGRTSAGSFWCLHHSTTDEISAGSTLCSGSKKIPTYNWLIFA